MTFIKRIITFMTAVAALISGFLGIDGRVPEAKAENVRVTSYVVSDWVQSPESVYSEDFDIITHVILFGCADFDAKGNINLQKEKLETALFNLRQAIGDRDVSISLNIMGPWGTVPSDIWEEQMEYQSDEHNKAFTSGVMEENILAVLKEYDFDGIHFDYEYPISMKAWFYYNRFLVALDKKLGDYTLGVAGNEWNLKFSTAALKAVDYIELMMYDIIDENGKHATFENITKLMRKTGFRGIPAEKINLGIPFYSRPTDGSTYWYGYNGCIDGIDSEGWYYDEEIDKHFWFNTPDVVYDKTQWAVNEGYGGVMIWHYSCDLPSSQENSLLRAVGEAVEDNS